METETITIDRSARNLAVGFDQPITHNGGLATLRRGYAEAQRMGRTPTAFVGGRKVLYIQGMSGRGVAGLINELADDTGHGVEVTVVCK